MGNSHRPTFGESIEAALARLKGATRSVMKGSAVAGALAFTVTGAAGCDGVAMAPTVDSHQSAVIGDGQPSWSQQQGKRDTTMVAYTQSSWSQFRDCNTRGGCMTVDVFLKVRVKPVAGADLSKKRVGVVYRTAGSQATAVGSYFTTLADGYEEWHVPVTLRAYGTSVFTFDAWYQDGLGNTFVDDNGGDLHPVAWYGSYSIIRTTYGMYGNQVTLDEHGVKGTIGAYVADLEYQKEIALVYTTDGWQTSHEDKSWVWVEDYGSELERWKIDVDIPGSFDKFEYALVYRHGGHNGGQRYEFWDNNYSQNYSVVRTRQ
jgi:hypothetical protein